MLELKNVTKYYGDLRAVNNLSFSISKGKIFGLLGTNGAGKSTTFKMIMGLLEPTEGEITFDGKKVDYDLTNNIGYLIEERSLLPKVKVYDQLRFIGKLKDMSDDLIDERIDYYLKRFDCLDYKEKKVKELSKGNQQKIQFISSVINNPKLLILDEPFSGLDPFNVEAFVKVMKELKEQGTIIIFSSHQMNYVEEFCEDLCVLAKGDAILNGNLLKIKEAYSKRNILICGDVEVSELEKIDGVVSAVKNENNILVKIEDETYIPKVFDYVKTCQNITKFDVVLPSLHEIYIDKVGKKYEE